MSDIFTSTYRPPGVYTSEEAVQSVGSVGVGATIIAIVGPSVGYMTATEAVKLDGTSNVRMSNRGIDTNSVSVMKSNGVVAILTDDYTLTPSAGTDTIPFTGDDLLDIKRSGSSTIADGETVVVTYRYTDSSFFTPRRFNDFNQVKDFYGPPLDSASGSILSPLSFAAKLAFDNGASQVVLLATPGSAVAVDKDDLVDGYAKLMVYEDISVVVPLPVGINGTDTSPGDVPSLGTDLKNHLHSAFDQGVRRIGILGYEVGVDMTPTTLASGVNSKRVAITWPSRVSYHNTFLSQTHEIAGYYAAAAEAGVLSTLPVNFPLTRKPISGIGIPSSVLPSMNRSAKDAWSQGGVMVLEVGARGVLNIRHGTATKTATVMDRELSLTRAADTMIRSVMTAIEAADLIGTPIVAETPARIKGIVSNVLETMKDTTIIVDYSGLSVRQTSVDPSVIEVRFQYRPAYPLNYVNIVFGVDPTTGDISLATEEV